MSTVTECPVAAAAFAPVATKDTHFVDDVDEKKANQQREMVSAQNSKGNGKRRKKRRRGSEPGTEGPRKRQGDNQLDRLDKEVSVVENSQLNLTPLNPSIFQSPVVEDSENSPFSDDGDDGIRHIWGGLDGPRSSDPFSADYGSSYQPDHQAEDVELDEEEKVYTVFGD